jgi:meso-butanediol dehydrogenase/(S,S)-butanediol dehydrogenase/diacetyl reductase
MSPSPVAFVTGGSRGIGAAIVSDLTNQGWRVATCARRLESLVESPAALRLACDVAEPAQVRAAVAELVSTFGRLDAVVNNAGLAGSNPTGPDDDDDLWHQILNTNLNGTWQVCKQALPHLPDGAGRIVNIGSVLSLRGVPDQPAYCAAKHAVLGLTRSLATLTAPRRITVNCVCPGWTRTEMAESRGLALGLSQEQLHASVPTGRMVEPDEVAALVRFLLSEAAASVNGQAIVIDGGGLSWA